MADTQTSQTGSQTNASDAGAMAAAEASDPNIKQDIAAEMAKTEEADDQAIAHEYFVMYIYNIFRLVIIAIMITYFIGCMVYFVSNEFNNEEDIENEKLSFHFLFSAQLTR